ncbi:MAG: hypothetical protein ACE5GN_02850 [Waddliaceae bacterium]
MRSRKFISIFMLSASLLMPRAVQAEVLEVVVIWNSISCNEKCAQILAKSFQKMKQVQEVRVNPTSGITILKWKPKSAFSYYPIKSTMQMIGVGVNDIRVKVRGKAKEQGNEVALFSLEDNTRFVLVSPITPLPEDYTVNPNPYDRSLSSDLRERILQEVKQDKVLVIEGPLYQPAKSPPLQLVVERIQIEKKKN